jgi:hypothetical protein
MYEMSVKSAVTNMTKMWDTVIANKFQADKNLYLPAWLSSSQKYNKMITVTYIYS